MWGKKGCFENALAEQGLEERHGFQANASSTLSGVS
jgi:hypothetical protein